MHASLISTKKNILTFFLLFFLLDRGLLELFLPKTVVFVLQLSFVVAIATLLFFPNAYFFMKERKQLLFFAVLFVFSLLLSAMTTFFLYETVNWIPLLIFNLNLLYLFILLVRNYSLEELHVPIEKFLLFFGWLLFLTALLEQLHLIKMPGSGITFFIRPSSLTGSFLHYPLVIVVIGFYLLETYRTFQTKIYLYSGILFVCSPFFYVSRSGALITISAFLVYPFILSFKYALRVSAIVLVVSMIVILFSYVVYVSFPGSSAHYIIERVVSAPSKKAIGNDIRIATWKQITKEWLRSNWLIGEETGKITNITSYTSKKGLAKRGYFFISESSPLELLSNFGLLGLIAFYGLFFQIARTLQPSHTLLKACFFGVCTQTLIYQSIEVVSLMGLVLLMPYVSERIFLRNKLVLDIPLVNN